MIGRFTTVLNQELLGGRGAIAVSVVLAITLVVPTGCSRNEPTVEIGEPWLVLDLVDGFADARVSQRSAQTDESGPPKAFVNPKSRVLLVPLGADVEYELEVPPGSVLLMRDARNLIVASGYLEVAWAPEGVAERILTGDLVAAPERIAYFGNTEKESGRLILRARGGGEDHDPQAAIRIFHPKVVAGVPSEPRQLIERSHGTDQRPNIVVYMIDALRADRVGCYGYGRGTTPNIDDFASSAVLFTAAQAQTSWTRPAVASVFTGLLPQQHGTIGKKDTLPESAVTIAELLTDSGYQSAAVVSNGNVSQIYGFSQGFSYYKYLHEIEIGNNVVRSEEVNESVFSWLDRFRGSEPFFLYVHTVDPHLPYSPPPAMREAFAPDVVDPSIGSVDAVVEVAKNRDRVTPDLVNQLSDLYDAEVAANDATFGELLAGLEQRGLQENTIIVVLSDHGEEFFDHRGWTHGNTLYAEMLDVPIIMRIPGVAPQTISKIVQHVDVFSTLLDLAGLEPVPGVFGRSTRPLWAEGPTAAWTDRSLAHLHLKERFGEAWVDPEWKMVTRRSDGGDLKTMLFNRVDDPTEQTDLAPQRPDLVEALRARYRDDLSAAGDSLAGVEVDAEREAEVEAQLRALGYL